jgi:hypothetical protein
VFQHSEARHKEDMSLSNTSLAPRRTTRQQRGIALFQERGEEIGHVEGWEWRVPYCSASGVYLVDLRAEFCECPDRAPEGEVCEHITAAIIARTESEECGGCRKKVLRRHLWTVLEDHPTLGGLVDELCETCAISQGVA